MISSCLVLLQKNKEPPADVLASPPAPPQLNLCSLRPGPTIAIPDKIIAEWSQRPTHGLEFQAVVKSVIDEFGEPKAVPANGNPADPATVTEPAAKKRRLTEPVEVVDTDKLPSTKLAEAPLSGLKKEANGKVLLRVDGTHGWWLSNTSNVQITLPAGTVVAGFGTGTFQHQPRHGTEIVPVDGDKMVLFSLTSDDSVLLNGKIEVVKNILHAREVQKGKGEVAYHEVSAKADPDFEITRKHEVYFKAAAKVTAEAEGDDLKWSKGTGSFASLVPYASLGALKHASVIWSVRWSAKGLMPVKPTVRLMGEVALDAHKAMKL